MNPAPIASFEARYGDWLKRPDDMSGLFYNLGRKVGPKVRKVKWFWQSIAGTEADTIKVEYQVGQDLAREIRCQLDLATFRISQQTMMLL